MAASLRVFLSNLAGAFLMFARYREVQLFQYRLRLALVGASLTEAEETHVIRSDGLTFYVRNPLEGILATTRHERGLLRELSFKAGGVFLDVGAHIGVYAVRAAKAGMTVECWEPDPGNRALLAKNLAANGLSAEIHAEALGDAEGELPFHLSGEQSSFYLKAGRVVKVRVATLDSYSLDRADLIKVDTEGYEVKVLGGARKTLSGCKPNLVVELHPFYAPTTSSDCTSVLMDAGYQNIRVFNSGRTKYLLASQR